MKLKNANKHITKYTGMNELKFEGELAAYRLRSHLQ